MMYILRKDAPLEQFQKYGGGKAANLAKMELLGAPVPLWFCLDASAFDAFVAEHQLGKYLAVQGDLKAFSASVERLFLSLPLPKDVKSALEDELAKTGLNRIPVAVRSSGLDEDSPGHSFAGQFSSFLFQKGFEEVEKAVKRCWASAYSERGLHYRIQQGLSVAKLGVGVVIQQMVDAESSGVAFTRNPINPIDRQHVLVSAVYGLGEGLVSGALEADHYVVDRSTMASVDEVTVKKTAFRQSVEGGVCEQAVPEALWRLPALTRSQVAEVTALALRLERELGGPQDVEWAIAHGKLYCLQARPITNMPPEAFYNNEIKGDQAVLWDNSNIIESYSGVVLPLTFSFARNAYREVYIQFCKVISVPERVVISYEPIFKNMLGHIRGRVYYNLLHWYKLVLLLPGTGDNPSFMETMMGVRQGLSVEDSAALGLEQKAQRYTLKQKSKLVASTLRNFFSIDSIVGKFHAHFDRIYEEAKATNFASLSLNELACVYRNLEESVLKRWQAPIINDCLCMVFFGLLKKWTERWMGKERASTLQNDLLCGSGDLESAEPTKMLMRMAARIDQEKGPLKERLLGQTAADVWRAMQNNEVEEWFTADFYSFLDRYGFRCVNELKLEENDLHDDPTFALGTLASYIRMQTYSIDAMDERERAIRSGAEEQVRQKLGLSKRWRYFWVLKNARKAIRYRENLRFARTKIFGIIRRLFRAVGTQLVALGLLDNARDVFYLTVDEIFGFIEGTAPSIDLKSIAELRKSEYAIYKKTPAPPDRFITYGAVGVSCAYPAILAGGAPKIHEDTLSDPNVLKGTPCCPGIVEGVVRVVHELVDAEGLKGEILVTERTDPGWVPLYPSCTGLLIERGSLLSHSAVVARELGLPTIVGIAGGLLTKLKTGDRVRMDAGQGTVQIIG